MLTLDREDIVLVMEWLEGMGDMKTNFRDLTLRIKKDGLKHTPKGNPTLCKGEEGFIV